MRVLFVGATGLIGRYVVPLLAENFDLKLASRDGGTVGEWDVIKCDITDFTQMLPLMEGVDTVVNCAIEQWNYSSPWRTDEDGAKLTSRYHEGCLEVNARGSYYLLEAAARAGVGKFVFISSMTAVMGEPKYSHVERDASPRPQNFYACTKLFGENLCSVYAHDKERPMRVLALRLGQPYPSMTNFDQRWQESTSARGVMVALQDVAHSIECALRADVNFGIYPILSRNDVNWVDVSANQEIGYESHFTFSADGLKELNVP